jgi:hypothetical protein
MYVRVYTIYILRRGTPRNQSSSIDWEGKSPKNDQFAVQIGSLFSFKTKTTNTSVDVVVVVGWRGTRREKQGESVCVCDLLVVYSCKIFLPPDALNTAFLRTNDRRFDPLGNRTRMFSTVRGTTVSLKSSFGGGYRSGMK